MPQLELRLPSTAATAGGSGFRSGIKHEQPDAIGAEAFSSPLQPVAEEKQLFLAAAGSGARLHRPEGTERRGAVSLLAATGAIAAAPRTVQQRDDEARTRRYSWRECAHGSSVPLREALRSYLLVKSLPNSNGRAGVAAAKLRAMEEKYKGTRCRGEFPLSERMRGFQGIQAHVRE